MPSTAKSLILQKRLHLAALATVAGYAILGPMIHPAVALGAPLRADLLGLAGAGFLASGSGLAKGHWRTSRPRSWVIILLVGALIGAMVVAPLVAIPWLLIPGLAMVWAERGAIRQSGNRWPAIASVILAACLNSTAVAAATAHGFRVSPEEFLVQDFRVNQLLGDIPIHDAWAVDLKAPPFPTFEDLKNAFRHGSALYVTPAIMGLGMIRGATGFLLGWEDPRWSDSAGSFLSRLTEADRRRSATGPGTTLGIWRVLYAFPREGSVETINGTVHVAVAGAIGVGSEGARLFLSFRVREVNWTTRPYMKLIDPPRRFFIYPFLLNQFAHTWERGGWSPPVHPTSGENP